MPTARSLVVTDRDSAGAAAATGTSQTGQGPDGNVSLIAPPVPRRAAGPQAAELLARALDYHGAGRLDQAGDLYRRVLVEDPANATSLHHLGIILHQSGDHRAGADLVRQAIALRPDDASAYSNLGAILRSLGQLDDAIEADRTSIALNPAAPQAHSNLGSVLEDKGDFEAALDAYRTATGINPNFVDAYLNGANLLRRLNRHQEALSLCRDIIERRPDAAEPYVSLGNILKDLCRPADAILAYRRAIALRPTVAEAHAALGNFLLQNDAVDEAVAAYKEAIALKPGFVAAHFNLAAAYETLHKIPDALEAYRAVTVLDPKFLGARFEFHHMRQHACDWAGIDEEERDLLARLATYTEMIPPFSVIAMNAGPAVQRQVALLSAARFAGTPVFSHEPPADAKTPGRRLRIGYLSGDFYRHATANLMAELFERHDRSGFEIIAYSHGPDDKSEMRGRLEQAFDQFVDLRTLSNSEAAARIRADRIDILVELKGYTQNARTGIAAHRPAPVQVSFIGFPGTMACDFIDYIIADPFVLPMEQQIHYSEKIVHLPDCYQPNDSCRRIASATPARTQCGLPDRGFVFCCFNNTYKITPTIFDIWMRLLVAVPGSVLWLFDGNSLVKENLRREATVRGVDPGRLVFAPRIDVADHIARQRLADLFLDTLPCNAHTTASDALWAGLPLLTCAGATFAGRVAGSLLHAVGVPDLVTTTLEDYEALALRLAREPELLFGMRQKLLANRMKSPLFDGVRFARHMEAAYVTMWETWADGRPAQPFAVARRSDVAAGCATATAETRILRISHQACPLCGGSDWRAIIGADCTRHRFYQPALAPRIDWHECGSCGHVFTEGYFDAATERQLFGQPLAGDSICYDLERSRPSAAALVDRVARHVGGGDWLDIGVGNGAILFAAEEWGYVPVGIDHRAETIAALQTLGYEAHRLEVAALDQVGRFGVASFVDGLDRMPFPRTALAAIHRLLRTGGALVLSMPNKDTMAWRLLDAPDSNPYWADLDRYHVFDRKRLYALLAEAGFRAVDYGINERERLSMQVIAIKS